MTTARRTTHKTGMHKVPHRNSSLSTTLKLLAFLSYLVTTEVYHHTWVLISQPCRTLSTITPQLSTYTNPIVSQAYWSSHHIMPLDQRIHLPKSPITFLFPQIHRQTVDCQKGHKSTVSLGLVIPAAAISLTIPFQKLSSKTHHTQQRQNEIHTTS